MSTIEEIRNYLEELFPITRSITGNGNRKTLSILKKLIPLTVHEIPCGTKVFDWVIPKEWNIREAWVKNKNGEKLIDFTKNNLHVVSYSAPVNKKVHFNELLEHVHFFKEQPDVIPYRTSYYNETWGFCLKYNQFIECFNKDEVYEVFIDSEFSNGSLTLADYILKGKSKKEFLLSTYFCHPSMANDNLSGIILTALLARELSKLELNYSYRFVFVPETIGAISYCSMNEHKIKELCGGIEVTCVGGPGKFGYKQTFLKDHTIDKTIKNTFRELEQEYIPYPFIPQGSDERQYSSPGFRVPVALITKDKYHDYEFYHTSGDDLDFVKPEYIAQSLEIYIKTILNLDKNVTFTSNNQQCEPQLGKRGLYPTIGRRTLYKKDHQEKSMDDLDLILWLMFYADGTRDLLSISEELSISISILYQKVKQLDEVGLLKIII